MFLHFLFCFSILLLLISFRSFRSVFSFYYFRLFSFVFLLLRFSLFCFLFTAVPTTSSPTTGTREFTPCLSNVNFAFSFVHSLFAVCLFALFVVGSFSLCCSLLYLYRYVFMKLHFSLFLCFSQLCFVSLFCLCLCCLHLSRSVAFIVLCCFVCFCFCLCLYFCLVVICYSSSYICSVRFVRSCVRPSFVCIIVLIWCTFWWCTHVCTLVWHVFCTLLFTFVRHVLTRVYVVSFTCTCHVLCCMFSWFWLHACLFFAWESKKDKNKETT